METKQIEVRCPCCEALITVDVRTRTVLKHVRAESIDADGRPKADESRWTQAAERASGRVDEAQEKLDRALDDERDKERRLDDLFDRANERLRDDD